MSSRRERYLPPFIANRLTKQETQKGVVVGSTHEWGKRITPTFIDMIKYMTSNPYVAAGIDELSEASVGSGFYTTAKKNQVKKTVDDWFEDVDLDSMNRNNASDLWACGNCILEQIDKPPNLNDLIHLPIGSFYKIYSTKYGKITKYEQDIEGTRTTFEGANVDKLILIKWKCIGTKPTGVGLLESLLNKGVGYTVKDQSGKEKTVYRPSFREISEEIEDAMRNIVVGYVPLHVFTFYGMQDEWVKGTGNEIKALVAGDKLIIGLPQGKQDKNKLEMQTLETDPRSRLHPFAQYFHNAIITGLETPSVRLFIEAGFTEASARTAVELRDQKVASFRRFYKRQMERRIAKPKAMQDMTLTERQWKNADFRIEWNPLQPPKFTNEQLIALLTAQMKANVWIVTEKEFRHILKKRGFELDITEESFTPEEVEEMARKVGLIK